MSRALLLASSTQLARATNEGKRGLGEARMRAVAEVANRALSLHALGALWDAGIEQVFVVAEPEVAPHLADRVPTAGRLVFLEGTPEAPLGVPPEVLRDVVGAEPFLVHLADSVCKGSLAGAIADGLTGELDSLVLVAPRLPRSPPGRVLRLAHDGGVVRSGLGGPTVAPAGVYVLGPGAIEASRTAAVRAGRDGAVAGVVERMRELGGHVRLREVDRWWRFDERPDALIEGNRFALEGLEPDIPPDLHGCDIQGGVVIDRTAVAASSLIRGPVVVGRDVRITDSYIGPYTSVGDGVVVEGAEVENSILLHGTVISHLGARLESSVIGPQARLFRDFRLPKAFRMNVGEGAEVSLT